MVIHNDIDDITLRQLIRRGEVLLAGNRKLGIFGLFSCASGKRMMRSNRVFFKDVEEAIRYGYRPCGHCLRSQYMSWTHQRLERDRLGKVSAA